MSTCNVCGQEICVCCPTCHYDWCECDEDGEETFVEEKTIYFNVDADGYISEWGTDNGDFKMKLDGDHPFFSSDHHCWLYRDGGIVFNVEKQIQREDEKNKQDNKLTENEMLAMAIMDLTELIMGGID